ncbi:MAG: biotin transporter BioY [Candidatus Latescibacterota bacterium]
MKSPEKKPRHFTVRLHSRDIALAGLMTALTACGAFIRVPLPYVPLTLQTFFVYLSGALLGSRLGALSQAAYVILGLMGIPLFAGGGGPAYVLHPTFGYLIGFIAAAYLIGRMVERKPQVGYLPMLEAMGVGLGVVYLLGLPIFYVNLHLVTGAPISFWRLLQLGCLVPLPGDVLKILAAAHLAARIRGKKGRNPSAPQYFC